MWAKGLKARCAANGHENGAGTGVGGDARAGRARAPSEDGGRVRARPRRDGLAVQLPEDGADSASDPRTRSNTAASWSSSANARSRRAFPGTTGAAETVTGT